LFSQLQPEVLQKLHTQMVCAASLGV
jgi:hypothetical protein